jgi:hypothetical protein
VKEPKTVNGQSQGQHQNDPRNELAKGQGVPEPVLGIEHDESEDALKDNQAGKTVPLAPQERERDQRERQQDKNNDLDHPHG